LSQNLKYSQIKTRSSLFSPFVVFIFKRNSVFAFKSPQLCDYQRKDLAKAGMFKGLLYEKQQKVKPLLDLQKTIVRTAFLKINFL